MPSSVKHVINPLTGRKISAHGRLALSLVAKGHKLCPPKKLLGNNKRCISEKHPDAKAMKKCQPGRVRNPASGRCTTPKQLAAYNKRKAALARSPKPSISHHHHTPSPSIPTSHYTPSESSSHSHSTTAASRRTPSGSPVRFAKFHNLAGKLGLAYDDKECILEKGTLKNIKKFRNNNKDFENKYEFGDILFVGSSEKDQRNGFYLVGYRYLWGLEDLLDVLDQEEERFSNIRYKEAIEEINKFLSTKVGKCVKNLWKFTWSGIDDEEDYEIKNIQDFVRRVKNLGFWA